MKREKSALKSAWLTGLRCHLFTGLAALDNFRQEPEKLEWTYNGKEGLKLYNPTRYVVQLHNVTANGREFKGKGVSFILLPMSGKNVSAAVNKGTRIKYGVINDYGAVKEYDGVVK